jgi:hypothetical protein
MSIPKSSSSGRDPCNLASCQPQRARKIKNASPSNARHVAADKRNSVAEEALRAILISLPSLLHEEFHKTDGFEETSQAHPVTVFANQIFIIHFQLKMR